MQNEEIKTELQKILDNSNQKPEYTPDASDDNFQEESATFMNLSVMQDSLKELISKL
jgi:uncharacterized protein with HEPN domain